MMLILGPTGKQSMGGGQVPIPCVYLWSRNNNQLRSRAYLVQRALEALSQLIFSTVLWSSFMSILQMKKLRLQKVKSHVLSYTYRAKTENAEFEPERSLELVHLTIIL